MKNTINLNKKREKSEEEIIQIENKVDDDETEIEKKSNKKDKK